MKKLSPYSYYEIKIEYNPKDIQAPAKIEGFLSEQGIRTEEIAFCETKAKTFAAAYTRTYSILKRIQRRFRKCLGPGFALKSRLLVREDWFDKWERFYKIMPLGTQFTLVPLWLRPKYEKAIGKRKPIFLDPKGASGSGQHPTTQIMILLLEQIEGKFNTCLDLGTGTGILGIAAAKLGAQSVTAIDNDSASVKSARYNLRLNQTAKFEALSGDVTSDKKIARRYSLVCANLISPILDSIQGTLFASVEKGGYLAVSGIYIENLLWFHKQFHHPQFKCLRILKRQKWAGLLFQRAKDPKSKAQAARK